MRRFYVCRRALLVLVFLQAGLALSEHQLPLSCPQNFSSLATTEAEAWKPPENIFGRSLPYMVTSAVAVLSITQVAKYALFAEPGDPIFSEAFPVTLAADTLTTLTSHAIAVSQLGWLQKIFKSSMGYWRRAGTNSLLGTAIINLTWLGMGVELGVPQACASLALCSVVYPTLQSLKTRLYQRWPLAADARLLQALQQDYPQDYAILDQTAQAQARQLGVAAPEVNFLLLSALEAATVPAIALRPLGEGWQDLLPQAARDLQSQYAAGERQRMAANLSPSELRKRRESQLAKGRGLINLYLDLVEDPETPVPLRTRLRELLSFGPDLSEDFSLQLHDLLRARLGGVGRRTAVAAVVDMSIAVGFFGGVCLEALNLWAVQTSASP